MQGADCVESSGSKPRISAGKSPPHYATHYKGRDRGSRRTDWQAAGPPLGRPYQWPVSHLSVSGQRSQRHSIIRRTAGKVARPSFSRDRNGFSETRKQAREIEPTLRQPKRPATRNVSRPRLNRRAPYKNRGSRCFDILEDEASRGCTSLQS